LPSSHAQAGEVCVRQPEGVRGRGGGGRGRGGERRWAVQKVFS